MKKIKTLLLLFILTSDSFIWQAAQKKDNSYEPNNTMEDPYAPPKKKRRLNAPLERPKRKKVNQNNPSSSNSHATKPISKRKRQFASKKSKKSSHDSNRSFSSKQPSYRNKERLISKTKTKERSKSLSTYQDTNSESNGSSSESESEDDDIKDNIPSQKSNAISIVKLIFRENPTSLYKSICTHIDSGRCRLSLRNPKNGQTIMHYIVKHYPDKVAGFIQKYYHKGLPIDKKDHHHQLTPLHYALGYAGNIPNKQEIYLKVAKALLDERANINKKDKSGDTPLSYAIQNNHKAVAYFILAECNHVNYSPELLNRLLFNTLQEPKDLEDFYITNLDKIYYLIDSKGVSVNIQDVKNNDNSILHYIASWCKPDKVREFTKKYRAQLQIDIINRAGETPLHTILSLASLEEQKGTQRYKHLCRKAEHLINAGADINKKSDIGQTALIFALYNHSKNAPNTIKRIINLPGIDVAVQDEDGDTALDIAALNNYTKLLEALLEKINRHNIQHQEAVQRAYELVKKRKEVDKDVKELLINKIESFEG